jgi:hypothetical protein
MRQVADGARVAALITARPVRARLVCDADDQDHELLDAYDARRAPSGDDGNEPAA